MKYIIALSLLIVTVRADVINTNGWGLKASYPTRIGATYNPTIDQLREVGWREYTPCQQVEGSNIVATSYADDGTTVTASCEYEVAVDPIPLPAQFDNGIAVLDDDGHWVKYIPVDGVVIPARISNSPIDPKTAKQMEGEAKRVWRENRDARRTRIERIADDLATVDAQIEGTNWADVILTNITVNAQTWTNATQRATITAIKQALQDTKDREQNLKTAVKNLMQATEKVRKEIE